MEGSNTFTHQQSDKIQWLITWEEFLITENIGFVETLWGHKKEEGNTNTGGSFTPSLPHPH